MTPNPQGANADKYPGLQITKDNKALRILLNRPDKKNALTWQVGLYFEDLGWASLELISFFIAIKWPDFFKN